MPSGGYRVWQIYIHLVLTRSHVALENEGWKHLHLGLVHMFMAKLKCNLVSCNLLAITWHSNENLTDDKFQRTAEWNKTYITDIDELQPNLSCEHCMACTYSVQMIATGFQYITVDDNSSPLGKKSMQTRSTSTIFEFSVEKSTL